MGVKGKTKDSHENTSGIDYGPWAVHMWMVWYLYVVFKNVWNGAEVIRDFSFSLFFFCGEVQNKLENLLDKF